MKFIVLLVVLISCIACNDKKETTIAETNQETMIDTDEDMSKLFDDPEEEGSKMLIGKVEVSALFIDRFAWFKTEFDAYTIDQDSMASLTEALKDKEILVIMGTWCEDSQREVPRLVKILANINHEYGPRIIAVNRDKDIPEGLENVENIAYVPTIIILENGIELGRIVESTQETLEKDLLAIATDQDYKHIYEE
ncbi:TlpA family protein disulfide reductase [Patiriisocius sp. Uisw_047]|jgi:thiol-disulfide isomerase/thioredoxin|uniref:TlpA family protein disulfide reductase n=1 Tax=Patiriisocius sp. Uisw_047 TaxID=3230969 RepID=UPI0039ED9997